MSIIRISEFPKLLKDDINITEDLITLLDISEPDDKKNKIMLIEDFGLSITSSHALTATTASHALNVTPGMGIDSLVYVSGSGDKSIIPRLGTNNNAGISSVINGGENNTIGGYYGSIGGGYNNFINISTTSPLTDFAGSFIGGGHSNRIASYSGSSVIGGGALNLLTGKEDIIGGGKFNSILTSEYSGILGGIGNGIFTDTTEELSNDEISELQSELTTNQDNLLVVERDIRDIKTAIVNTEERIRRVLQEIQNLNVECKYLIWLKAFRD